MARPLRMEFPGAVYHITSRGDGGESIFLSDADRKTFLALFSQTVDRFGWLCHAYCLMKNHYHFLVETPRPNLSRGMRHLNGVYTQTFNRKHQRFGHVFQGRFKAILVQKDAHLLELCRYVVLNPVRAGIVKRPQEWSWSSYRATVGMEPTPPWLSTDWILRQFGRARHAAISAYRRFVAKGAGKTVWDRLMGQIYFGEEQFIKQLKKDETLREVPRVQRQPFRPPLSQMVRDGTATEVSQAYTEYGYSLGEIAAHLGMHYSTVSRRLREYEKTR